MRHLLLAALVALFTSNCMHTTAAIRPTVDCRVEPGSPLAAGGPAEIRIVLANPTSEPIWFLRWNTPFEGWRGTIFTLTGPDKAEIPFTGPMVKRGEPGRDEYVQIPPGGEVDATVDLATVYELRNPGRYRLRVTGGLADLTADGASLPRPRDRHQGVELRCKEVEFTLTPR
jgi:peptidyl-Lys metalloendopeptidase